MPRNSISLVSLLLFLAAYSQAFKYSDSNPDERVCKAQEAIQRKDYCELYRADFGAPIPSYTAARTCGGRNGPVPMEDITLTNLLAGHVRETVPQRIVENKGSGAHGYLEITHDISKLTKADLFSAVGKRTPVFCRFAITTAFPGTPDTSRSFNGFACKHYTNEGNWDAMALGMEQFFIRDPMMFPSLIHTRNAQDPATGQTNRNITWDFFTQRQESTTALLEFYSDQGTVKGFRHMSGFSENAYKLVNKEGRVTYFKFQWQTQQGVQNFTLEEAIAMRSTAPNYFRDDLANNIKQGNWPSWTLCFQMMTPHQANKVAFNPFDTTIVWPDEEFPCKPVGKMTLNRNTENFFAEVEQVGLSPANLVPGIEPSPDRLLQARLFAYNSAHRYRIGVNFNQLPINKPQGVACCPHSINRDGLMCYDNKGGEQYYYPNSYEYFHPDKSAAFLNYEIEGIVERLDLGNKPDIENVRYVWGRYSHTDQDNIAKNLAADLKDLEDFLKCRALEMFGRVSPKLQHGIEHYGNFTYIHLNCKHHLKG